MNLLVLLNMPDGSQAQIAESIRQTFPEIEVSVVSSLADVGPHIGKADALIPSPYMVNDDLFRDGTKLKWVQCYATGVDGITGCSTFRPETILTTARGVHRAAVSEAAVMGMLAFARHLPEAVKEQRAHHWVRWSVPLLSGATAGIFGIGAISEALGPRLKALGMNVIGFTSTPRPLDGFDEVRPRTAFRDSVSELDYLVLLAPLDDSSRRIVDAGVLEAMKSSAILVNVGRGGLVDEPALIEALKNGTIAGAALDVFETEPLPKESPLWDMPNVFVTPHVGGFHTQYTNLFTPIVLENIRLYLEGRYDEMVNLHKQ